MLHQEIHRIVVVVKESILEIVQENLEPAFWEELTDSYNKDGRRNYQILNDDLPIVRDLKAIINMLTAIERATEKFTQKYGLFAVSLFEKLELPNDFLDLRRNFRVYRSTTSILTFYLLSSKDLFLTFVFPKLLNQMRELSLLCTSANLEKAADFFIEQTISLEQYKENYLFKKSAPPTPLSAEEKTQHSEHSLVKLVKKIDTGLRKILKDKYPEHFHPKTSPETKPTDTLEIIDYYPENKQDADTIKHIKLLLNGVIGINKVLEDHEKYQLSGTLSLSSVTWLKTLIQDLIKAYNSFQEFDYRAIIAEQAAPLTEALKFVLQLLNDELDKLACIADQFENEFRLKEGTLLKRINLLIERHNHITMELRIKTDYVKQKGIYYKSRLRARDTYLKDIDHQLQELEEFIIYKNHALIDIPYPVLQKLQNYIEKHKDLCMNHEHLESYNGYLNDALSGERGFKTFIFSQLEYIGNCCGLTLHHEFMTTLTNRYLYLQNQKAFLQTRFKRTSTFYENEPYDFFKLSDLQELGQQASVLKVLKKHLTELTSEKEALLTKLITKEPAHVTEKQSQLMELKFEPKKTKARLANQKTLKIQEHGIFSTATLKQEENTLLPYLREIDKEICLTPKSAILLEEIQEILTRPERKFA